MKKKNIIFFGNNQISKICFLITKKKFIKNFNLLFNPKKIPSKNFLGISIKYNKIIKHNDIKKFEIGIINFHFGELPMFRGLYSKHHTLRLKTTKKIKNFYITSHFIDKKIDKGRIIKKYPIKLTHNETLNSLDLKSNKKFIQIFKKDLNYYFKAKFRSYKSTSRSNYFDKNSYNNYLDLKKNGSQIEDHIKSLTTNFYKEKPLIKIGSLLYKVVKI